MSGNAVKVAHIQGGSFLYFMVPGHNLSYRLDERECGIIRLRVG